MLILLYYHIFFAAKINGVTLSHLVIFYNDNDNDNEIHLFKPNFIYTIDNKYCQ